MSVAATSPAAPARMKSYYDITGDGGSKILEQVGAIRARVGERLAGVRHRLAIGSGKGGVGKSTLTRQLATALSRRGRACAILDADLNGPSQARLADVGAAPLVPGPKGGLSMPRSPDGIGVVSLGSLVGESQAVEFDSVAGGDSHIWRATREFTFLGQLLGTVRWGELDFLLIDLPPGAERTFQYAEFLGRDAAFVLVSTPSELARGIVSRSVAALGAVPNRLLGYVENMCGYYCAGCDDVRPLFPETRAADFGIPCLGRVPFDPELARSGGTAAAGTSDLLDRVAERMVNAVEREAQP